MIDTIRISTDFNRDMGSEFWKGRGWKTGREGQVMADRMWKSAGEVRFTYFPVVIGGGRLVCEVSLCRLVYGDRPTVLNASEVEGAFDAVNTVVDTVFGPGLPAVRDWLPTRVDYCCIFDVGKNMPLYLAALSSVDIPRYIKTTYPGAGVAWRNKGEKLRRRIKFYDKMLELENRVGSLLRFEVSNHASACRDLAERVLGQPLTLGTLVNRGVAVGRMQYWIDKVGLNAGVVERGLTREIIKDKLGVGRVARAELFLSEYAAHGPAMAGQLFSQSQYYYWRKLVDDAGLLVLGERALPALRVDAVL